jgi:hypothetical protein
MISSSRTLPGIFSIFLEAIHASTLDSHYFCIFLVRRTEKAPAPGTRRNMSHEVELTKERASAVPILKASRPLMSKEKTRMPGLWLAYCLLEVRERRLFMNVR